MLVDAHAHLNDKRLFPIIDEVVDDYRRHNVGVVVNAGYDLESSKLGRLIAEKYEDCYFTAGLHPHDARLASTAMYDEMIELAKSPKAAAWGEIGLDYHYDLSPREKQQKEFIAQLEIADNLSLPVVIHLRDAYEDINKILKANKHYLKNKVLLHCYSGSAELARDVYNKEDFYYSFGGAITFAKRKDEVLRHIPISRILLETDCPYMTPVPLRGKLNRPSYLYLVRDKMAELLEESPEIIEDITTQNAKNFYKRIRHG